MALVTVCTRMTDETQDQNTTGKPLKVVVEVEL
jgi:hypothetical protein